MEGESFQCARIKDLCTTYKTTARVKIHSRRLACFFHITRVIIVVTCIVHIIIGKLYLVYLPANGDSNIFSSGVDPKREDAASAIFCDPEQNSIFDYYWSESWQYKNFSCPTMSTSQFLFKPVRGQFFASTHISASFVNRTGNVSQPRPSEEWFTRGIDGMGISIEHTALVRTSTDADADLELHYMPALKIEDQDGNIFKEFGASEWPSLTVQEMLTLAGIPDGLDQENPSCQTTVDEVPYGSDYCTYRLSGIPILMELYYSNTDHVTFGTGEMVGTLRVFKLDGWSSNTGGATFDAHIYDDGGNRVEAVTNYHYGIYIQTVQKGASGVFYFSSFLIVVVSYIVLIGIAATAADIVIGSGGCCQLSKEFNQKVYAVDIVDHTHKLEKCMQRAKKIFASQGDIPFRVHKVINENYGHAIHPEAHVHNIMHKHYAEALKPRQDIGDTPDIEGHIHRCMQKHYGHVLDHESSSNSELDDDKDSEGSFTPSKGGVEDFGQQLPLSFGEKGHRNHLKSSSVDEDSVESNHRYHQKHRGRSRHKSCNRPARGRRDAHSLHDSSDGDSDSAAKAPLLSPLTPISTSTHPHSDNKHLRDGLSYTDTPGSHPSRASRSRSPIRSSVHSRSKSISRAQSPSHPQRPSRSRSMGPAKSHPVEDSTENGRPSIGSAADEPRIARAATLLSVRSLVSAQTARGSTNAKLPRAGPVILDVAHYSGNK